MDAAAEGLAADLGVDGISAWGRLYDTITGKMTFTMTWPDGRVEQVPMSQRRALLTDVDPRVRAAAFTGGNKVWEASEDVMGAALNALAGTRHTLYARRGRDHFLAAPLHDSAVSRETIDAMFQAITANYDVGRRILQLGARLQGTPALKWHDLDVPQLPSPFPVLDWRRGVELVDRAFGDAYPRLQVYFRSMLERRWIESEKRPNKRAGAFLTGSPVTREERIFMTYGSTIGDVNTLAHEVGHAWHTHLLASLRPCARDYPMTLAETASTFAEMVLAEGLLAAPGLNENERAYLIEQSVAHAPSYLLNIPVRFLFESRFYEERKAGTVAVSRIKSLMIEAQREVYGDVLAPGGEDPWFWASKLHFYISGVSFYNFPYTFGFLLSQALFQEFKRQGPAFLGRYEKLLGLTGRATCEEVVRESLGRDLRDPQFWADAIRGLAPRIDEYAVIVAKRRP
jgi:oligoendopeptidase F